MRSTFVRLTVIALSLAAWLFCVACQRTGESEQRVPAAKDSTAPNASFGLTKHQAVKAPAGIVYVRTALQYNFEYQCLDFRTQEADDDHTKIQLLDCRGNTPQQFELVNLTNGMSRLRSMYRRDRYVGGWGVDPQNAAGAEISASPMDAGSAGNSQSATLFQWHFVPTGSPREYYIVNLATGICLAEKGEGDSGFGVQQYFCKGDISQRWVLDPA